jgi:putative FmdB family regulatory protein
MPLYDIRCRDCGGIFERLFAVDRLRQPTACPYCCAEVPAEPMLTGTRVALRSVDGWRPASLHEQLAGKSVGGPGTAGGRNRNSVLHVCGGKNCSICGL